jgi:hypothetical protein
MVIKLDDRLMNKYEDIIDPGLYDGNGIEI